MMNWESNGHILHRVYLLETWVFQQTETSNAKHGMKDINHVTRSVCEATKFRILGWLDSDRFEDKIAPTWHCRMKFVNFWPSIQCSLSSMDMLLMTHQL